MLPGGERDRPPRAVQLLGDLHAAGGPADDEDAAVRELGGIPVVQGRDGIDARRSAAASAGSGEAVSPAASTTARARHSPRSVATVKPCSAARTAVTVVPVRTGASATAAYPAMNSAVSAAVRYPSGSAPP
nr:hypothetical protein GCM10025732_28210 [Glycomyces mayteni]